jgi:hypothetical protein
MINLSAPDAVIRDEFEKALRAARETYPSPVLKRGPQTLDAFFGEPKFSTWRRYKILQLADLLAWNTDQESKVSGAQLGRWLNFSEKETALAKEELFKALDSIKALSAQIAAEHRSKNPAEEQPGPTRP